MPAIRRARLDQLTIYDVTEAELEILERGSPDSLYLNFAIALLSTAVSFSVTLATTPISVDRTFQVFLVLTVVGYVAATVLLSLWFRTRQSVSTVTATIRSRLPPLGISETPLTP